MIRIFIFVNGTLLVVSVLYHEANTNPGEIFRVFSLSIDTWPNNFIFIAGLYFCDRIYE
jgi:hypothetical protein